MSNSTQITVSGDVGAIATASNENGSIRWHVYERFLPDGVISIYVQRELNGVLQPEVRFVRDGQNPEVYFDTVTNQWILLYVFNQALWMLRVDENDAPVTQISQLGTFISHRRIGLGWDQDSRTAAQRQEATADTREPLEVTTTSMQVVSVGVAASPVDRYFRIRWRPQLPADFGDYQTSQSRIAGFNVYLKHAQIGSIRKINDTLIPYQGIGLHEYETLGRPGYWMVTQVENWGTGGHSTNGRLVEGRLGQPRDLARGSGGSADDVIKDFMPPLCGGSYPGEDVRLTTISFAPVQAFPSVDNFSMTPMGLSGETPEPFVPFAYTQVVLGDVESGQETEVDMLPMGLGSEVRLSQTGFGSIIVG